MGRRCSGNCERSVGGRVWRSGRGAADAAMAEAIVIGAREIVVLVLIVLFFAWLARELTRRHR
jgi:hypothetical protein